MWVCSVVVVVVGCGLWGCVVMMVGVGVWCCGLWWRGVMLGNGVWVGEWLVYARSRGVWWADS
jgi:hypothetical protein